MSELKQEYERVMEQLTVKGGMFELTQVEVNGLQYQAYNAAPSSVTELINRGRDFGDSTFLVYQDERISFAEFFRLVDQVAFCLQQDYGVKPKDRVAIAMRNYPEWMVFYLAILDIGAVAVPLNSWGQTKELTYGLEGAQVAMVACDGDRLALIEDFVQEHQLPTIVVRSEEQSSYVTPLKDLLVEIPQDAAPEYVGIYSDDPAMIMYTSGTTGLPKGAVVSHRNICNAILNFECTMTANAMLSSEIIGKAMAKGYPQAALLAVPLFHVSGCLSQFIPSLRMGRKLVILHKWNAADALRLIEQERITSFGGVSNMIQEMLDAPEFASTDLDSLFGIGGGGGAQPPHLEELIQAKMPDALAGTGWGLTESTATGTSCTGSTYLAHPTSTGLAAPIVSLKICDARGHEVPQGETGEVWVYSATNISGYWNNLDATQQTFRDGWLRSGDMGYLNEDGYLFIAGRIKEVVIRGGENIYPVEVEQCIATMPGVKEVAAVGIPNQDYGEELVAGVVPHSENCISERQVQGFVAERLAKFKVPAWVFCQTDPLPRNATGKLLKRKLIDSIVAEVG